VPFTGFPSGKLRLTPVPAQFFSELLPEINHLGELKVTLYAIWFLDQLEDSVRYLTFADFSADQRLLAGLAPSELDDCLERAVQRGSLLRVQTHVGEAPILGEAPRSGETPQPGSPGEALYFLNSARGRAAVQAIERGEWVPSSRSNPGLSLEVERPNIFRLYEQNIGPLTPLIAETLQDAEQSYPPAWIEEAFKLAVEKNVRKWNYIRGILKSWQEEGRDQTDRRNAPQNRRKYVEGEFSDFIKH
jgi:DnaD/phage-associated family protein